MYQSPSIFSEPESTVSFDQVIDLFQDKLTSSNFKITSLVVEGCCKLFLLKSLSDLNILKNLVGLFFSTKVKEMEQVSQCLSYFFSVFPFVSAGNQNLIAQVILNNIDSSRFCFNSQ